MYIDMGMLKELFCFVFPRIGHLSSSSSPCKQSLLEVSGRTAAEMVPRVVHEHADHNRLSFGIIFDQVGTRYGY